MAQALAEAGVEVQAGASYSRCALPPAIKPSNEVRWRGADGAASCSSMKEALRHQYSGKEMSVREVFETLDEVRRLSSGRP